MTFPLATLESISAKIDYGLTASAVEREGEPRFLRITDLQNDTVDWNTVPSCDCSQKDVDQYKLENGDIVFARTGATTGKSYLISNIEIDAVFASYLIRVRPNPKVDPLYLSYFFKSTRYWHQITSMANGAAQPGVNSSKLKELEIPLPPLPEQQRIAAILDKADAIRRKRQQAIQLADEFLRSVFLEMFGDPVTNPKGWDVKPLEENLDFMTSGSRGWAQYYSDSGSKFIRIQNVSKNRLLLDDLTYVNAPEGAEAIRTKIRKNDVLLSITADLGRSSVVTDEIAGGYINQHLALLRLKESCLNPRYLSAYLSSEAGVKQFQVKNKSAVKAGLNFSDIKTLEIIMPPLNEQIKYEKIYEKVMAFDLSLKKAENTAQQAFNALSQRVFAGEL